VARAKSTDRAEARRKYRAYLQAQEEAAAAAALEQDAGSRDAAAEKVVRGRDPRTAQGPQPGVRMGMMAAARAAYRTPHYIDDVRGLWPLITRTNAVWPILIMSVVSGAYMSLRIGNNGATTDPILPAVYQFVFYPVPLLPPMIAGFLAPRSTWLAGMIAAFIATMTLVIVVGLNAGSFSSSTGAINEASASPIAAAAATGSVVPTPGASLVATATPASSGSPAASPAASGSSAPGTAANTGKTGKTGGTTAGDLLNLAFLLLVQSLGFGAMIGALSGWYKRFLALTSGGQRRPPASRPGRGRTPPQRRRTATR
jgi:hypothetical protein